MLTHIFPLLLVSGVALCVAWLVWRYRATLASYSDRRAGANPFRMVLCGLAALACLGVVAAGAAVQLQVAAYKLALVFLAGYVGYWLDVWLFPYARPDGYLLTIWQAAPGHKSGGPDHAVADGYQLVFAAALIRRALIVGLCMLAVGLGL
ncbi:hypothetical protein JCM15519_03650 [Fundidesulfovibrio butyratiphilus]